VVDDNRVSMLGYTDDIISMSALGQRLEAFGWACEGVDGHDVRAVTSSLNRLKSTHQGKPKALLCRTLKGRGVPGLENAALAHIMNPKPELVDELLEATK
jgi:transketolase